MPNLSKLKTLLLAIKRRIKFFIIKTICMTDQEKSQLIKLLNANTFDENVETLNILAQIIINLTKNHHFDEIQSEKEVDAKLTAQLVLSKIQHLNHLSDGIALVPNAIKKLHDPSVNLIISRNIFETVIHFNLLHILYKNEDPEISELIYLLWKLSSLKYRKRLFEIKKEDEKSPEIKAIQESEEIQIEEITNRIKNLQIYISGSVNTVKQIKQGIKQKKIWLIIDENQDIKTSVGPQKLCDKMTRDVPILKEQYNRFSLLTHPSKETTNMLQNISDTSIYKELTKGNLRITNCLIAMFISDLIKVFPNMISTFERMPIEQQIICTVYNRLIREPNTGINESYKIVIDDASI